MNDDQTKHDLAARFAELVEQLSVQMRPHPVTGWSQIELTLPQLRTLHFLSRGSQRMSDIARFLQSGLSATTSLVDRLEDKQLVQRVHEAADRRVVRVRLTALGEEEIRRFWQVQREQIDEVTAVLTIDELRTVVNATEIVINAFGARDQSVVRQQQCADDERTPDAI